MQVVIRGRELPGLTFRDGARVFANVHVALQVRKEPEGLIPGDAFDAEWHTEVRVVEVDGLRDFRGAAVHGRRGERFLYLTWGEVIDQSFGMFRRAKIMLDEIPDLDQQPDSVVATVVLTDAKGGPTCGRVRSPLLRWDIPGRGGQQSGQ